MRILLALFAVLILFCISLLTGVSSVTIDDFLIWQPETRANLVIVVSRFPRTISLVLAGVGLAIAGATMQMLVRNRFVEPSTAGTIESASFGLLMVTLFAPGMAIFGKMLVASVTALMGTGLFMLVLSKARLRSEVFVPIIGIMLGGIIGSVSTFIAYRYNLLQSLGAWTSGDFSGVLRGRYELLWLTLVMVIIAYFNADRLTLMSLGKGVAVNLGVNPRRMVFIGLAIVSMVAATVVVSAGSVPFLGLIVPNIVSRMMGDNLRHSMPSIALAGAAFVLVCDIIGRLIIFPYEIPASSIAGIIGSIVFLYLILGWRQQNA